MQDTAVDTTVFVQRVRRFVDLVDHADWSRPYDVLHECARLLPQIYAMGLDLPDVIPSEDDITFDGAIPRFAFGRWNCYYYAFDAYFPEKGETIAGLLSDDFGDIYVGLAGPLAAYDAGRQDDAFWQWRFNISGHCGDHIVGCLPAIHRAVNDHMASDYNPQHEASRHVGKKSFFKRWLRL